MPPTVVLSPRGEERLRTGHPWIYRSDVVRAEAEGGDLVAIVGARGRRLGHALYSSRSEIALRLFAPDRQSADANEWRRRLNEAIAYRAALRIDGTAYRLVHGEADRLPSLVVDRYGDYLVLQALSQAVDRLQPDLTQILVQLLSPRGILGRNDARVRVLEGLERRVDVLYGEVPDRVLAREGRVEYDVDLRAGQKTGLFLDQRENREAAARYARGRLLDAFSYNGGFSLRLAPQCSSVLAVDISADAVDRIAQNAARNGLANVEARVANAFDLLRAFDRDKERFDTVVLDPPAFAKNRAALPRAVAGYKEINLRALRLLAPGGHLITCTCSYHVQEHAFGELLQQAATDAHVTATIVEKRMQARDHPVLLGVPETYYLKCFVLRRLV